MTEEEKIEWAKNYTWKPRKRLGDDVITTTKSPKAKKILKQREFDRKRYNDPEKKAKRFNDTYNERIRYLYQHNEEFRELKKYRVKTRISNIKSRKYEAWSHKYYSSYRNKMETKATVFRLGNTDNHLYGFSFNDLCKYSPFYKVAMKTLLNQNIFPEPKYFGYRYKDGKYSKKEEAFYLVSEIESLMGVFARYKKQSQVVQTEAQKLWLKKQLWTDMLKAREEFDSI